MKGKFRLPRLLALSLLLLAACAKEPDVAAPRLPWRTRNAAVSGSTTAGVLEAARWALTPDVKLVFVCIGGNDGLRGTPLIDTNKNLNALLEELGRDGRTVVLA